jgi:hypothetical protein
MGNVITFGFGLGAPVKILTLGFGPTADVPDQGTTYPTSFRVEVVAPSGLDPTRTKIVDL